MKNTDINIRDPFVLYEDGTYYLYGTRAKDFGIKVGGFDVYTSSDMINWSEPNECFDSKEFSINTLVNWAPEVHKYKGAYYMFATFTDKKGKRGTHVLKADSPMGPFKPHSDGAVTPHHWMALDGTLYIENGVPYLVFCHEHVQIIDGAMCYIRLSEDLKQSVGKPVTLFRASQPEWVKRKIPLKHYITDGPFMYKTKDNVLLMIWSTFIDGKYAECVVRFKNSSITGDFEHLKPLFDDDGGHGMIFKNDEGLFFTYHTPNKTGTERPAFVRLKDCGDCLEISK